jgi:hypothetical protein
MTDGEHLFQEIVRETVQEPLRRSRQDRDDSHQLAGFTAAAGIALRTFNGRIGELKEHLRDGSLTPLQQMVLIELEDLKSKFEKESDGYWRGTGAGWHPVMPVAKAIVGPRHDGEPDPND